MKGQLAIYFVLLLFFSSCVSQKSFTYFQPGEDEITIKEQKITEATEIRIQPDDILAILVTTDEPQAADPFNIVRSDMNGNNLPINDYLVDEQGRIDFPGLGKVMVKGLTVREAKDKMTSQLSEFLKDPVINIRLTNFTVNVMGEVVRPGNYRAQGEKLTILEAIAMAGDLTDFADRENVLLIRERDGNRTFNTINLLRTDLFSEEYFYLSQNDVIYVAPTKIKSFSVGSRPFREIVLPVVSVGLSLASLIIIANR